MLRRIILALCILLLPLPAVAAPFCHEQTQAQQQHAAHATHEDESSPKGPHEQSSQSLHGCIGCAAPMNDVALAPVKALEPFAVTPKIVRALAGTAIRPALRPPRS